MNPITSLLFTLLLCLLQLSPITPSESKFFVTIGNPKDPQPTCTGIDSQHTYLCTEIPATARNALGLTDRGTYSNERNMVHLGVSQRLSGSEQEIQRVQEVLSDMIRYIDEEVMSRSEYEHVRESCVNQHELCAFWTSVGECESNRVFMLQNCAAACRLCLLKSVNMVGG